VQNSVRLGQVSELKLWLVAHWRICLTVSFDFMLDVMRRVFKQVGKHWYRE